MLKFLCLELQPAGWGDIPPSLLVTQTHSKRKEPGACPWAFAAPSTRIQSQTPALDRNTGHQHATKPKLSAQTETGT